MAPQSAFSCQFPMLSCKSVARVAIIRTSVSWRLSAGHHWPGVAVALNCRCCGTCIMAVVFPCFMSRFLQLFLQSVLPVLFLTLSLSLSLYHSLSLSVSVSLSIDHFTYYCHWVQRKGALTRLLVSTVKRRRSTWRRKALLLPVLGDRQSMLKASESLRGLVLY